MAVHFNAELDEGNDASTITMNNKKANGFISSYQVFPGLTVWVYNITFRSDFKVCLELSKGGPIYFSYNVKGHFLHRFLDEEEFSEILQNQHMIVMGDSKAGVEIIFPANIKLEIAVIIIDMKKLDSLDARNAKRLHIKVQRIFQFVYGGQRFRHLGSIDTETKKYASIVCENNDTDLVVGLMTEGAILNMLASQIQAYGRDNGDATVKPILLKSELSRLSSLGDYIMDNLDQNLTVSSLGREFGMSPNKLQIAVKHLYGDSVGQYMTNIRMGLAKHLLEATDLSCSEVSSRVGISSKSYFSKLFKNRYGISPSLI
jgi:AraC-like DNA-binding protein